MAEVHHKQYQRMFRDDMTEMTTQDLEIIKKLQDFELDSYGLNGLDPNAHQSTEDEQMTSAPATATFKHPVIKEQEESKPRLLRRDVDYNIPYVLADPNKIKQI